MVAQRLEPFVPAMRSKGRLAVGADADVTVFDPARVIDRATYEKPAQFSEGIRHVLVGGTFIVRDEQLVPNVTPGRPIRNGALILRPFLSDAVSRRGIVLSRAFERGERQMERRLRRRRAVFGVHRSSV